MELIITLRREVTDRDQGEAIYELVRQKLADQPEVKVRGHITNHFQIPEEES